MKLKKAFTLAEVLITLVIIGVVAALTIPVLNNSQSDKALKSAAKKNATVFQQALDHYQAGNSAPFVERNLNSMVSNVDKFLSYLKADELGAEDGLLKDFEKRYKYQSGEAVTLEDISGENDNVAYRLADGTDFTIGLLRGYGPNEDAPWLEEGAMMAVIDTNGTNKGPNVLGKDLIILIFEGKTNKLGFHEDLMVNDFFKDVYDLLYE